MHLALEKSENRLIERVQDRRNSVDKLRNGVPCVFLSVAFSVGDQIDMFLSEELFENMSKQHRGLKTEF